MPLELRSALAGLTDLLFPPCCGICLAPLLAGSSDRLCELCLLKLGALRGQQCPLCAASVVPGVCTPSGCPHCRTERYAFSSVLACGAYRGVLRDSVLRLKHSSGESLAWILGRWFADARRDDFQALPVDAIVPVPLHWTRRLWRGYNQAAALAQALAGRLRKPCPMWWLWRPRQTARQTTLSPKERRVQLRRAFRARLPAKSSGPSVLLVDDVMTTGSTAHGCAKALLSAGATEVHVAVLARAVGEFDPSGAGATTGAVG